MHYLSLLGAASIVLVVLATTVPDTPTTAEASAQRAPSFGVDRDWGNPLAASDSYKDDDLLPGDNASHDTLNTASIRSNSYNGHSGARAPQISQLGHQCADEAEGWCGSGLTCAYPPDQDEGSQPICLPVTNRVGGTCTIPITVGGPDDDNEASAVCGRGLECYQGQCVRVNAIGAFCSLPGQSLDFCGRGVCADSIADFGARICQTRVGAGDRCNYLAFCADGTACVEDNQDPLGFGTCQ